jgi:hypothetical protein
MRQNLVWQLWLAEGCQGGRSEMNSCAVKLIILAPVSFLWLGEPLHLWSGSSDKVVTTVPTALFTLLCFGTTCAIPNTSIDSNAMAQGFREAGEAEILVSCSHFFQKVLVSKGEQRTAREVTTSEGDVFRRF